MQQSAAGEAPRWPPWRTGALSAEQSLRPVEHEVFALPQKTLRLSRAQQPCIRSLYHFHTLHAIAAKRGAQMCPGKLNILSQCRVTRVMNLSCAHDQTTYPKFNSQRSLFKLLYTLTNSRTEDFNLWVMNPSPLPAINL